MKTYIPSELDKLKIVAMDGDIMHDAVVLALVEILEKEISEAEARGEARMKEKCIAIIPDPEPLAEMGFDAEALASFLSFNISSL